MKKPVILGPEAFAAIAAIEGLKLNEAGLRRVSQKKSPDEIRAEIVAAYKIKK